MTPAHGGGVRQQLVGRRLADRAEVSNRVGYVGRVPIDDGGDDEVETRCPKLLSFMCSVGDAALFEGADRLREEVALLGFVETWLASAAQSRAFQPIQHELGYATPAAFAAELEKQWAASLRIARGYATQPIASPAHLRNNDAETLIATG